MEIEKPRPSCTSALDYNEGKVLRGVASLVAYANMGSVAREDIYALFERYLHSAIYDTAEVSFHASVNPSEKDTCSEEDILEFITALMEHLHMGRQPYLVYRHFDIEREHYHVVSIRIDGRGRKIGNYYEKRNVSAFMRRVAPHFSFTVAGRGERVLESEDLSVESVKPSRARFNPREGVVSQMKEIFSRALSYDFDGSPQLECILSDMGLKATLDRHEISLQGTNRKGEPVTRVFTEADLREPLYQRMTRALEGHAQSHRLRHREKERVRSLAGFAFEISKSEGHFVNILRGKGVSVHFSRTKGSGDIFGATFVDHSTRTVFRASELRSAVSILRMQEAVATGKWRLEERGRKRSTYVGRSRSAVKQDSLRLRDLHVGAVAKVLKPVGQPHGNSWSGKIRLSEEELRERMKENEGGAVYANFEDRRFVEKNHY